MSITTITSGIKYIKISKTDLAGANRDNNLNSLQKLRLKYNDIGVAEYDIINISEFSDHYLYSVFANNNVSATDNEILNYTFSAGPPFISPLNNVSPYGDVIINWSPGGISNPLGYFKRYAQGSPFGGGAYTVGKSANANFVISVSYTVGSLNPGDFAFLLLVSSIRGILNSITISQSNPTGTFNYFLPNLYSDEIIRIELSPSSGGSGVLTNMNFNITPFIGAQSVSPTLTILEPIIPPNFYNSSCNATINNATENRFSLDYQKVDYPYASITAQNTQAIINGSANRAQVQDSNYTSLRHANPRYNGSRLIGAQLNEYTPGDLSYGKTAVIEQNQKYFGYFDWVGAFEPELKGATAAHVIYLIDEQGNAIPTREDFDKGRYYDLVYNFERDKEALISLKVPEEVPSLKTMNGLKRILYSGADITPIVHTDDGVNYSVGNIPVGLVSIEFNIAGFNTANYGGAYMTVGLKNLRDSSILIDQTFSPTSTGVKTTTLTYQGSLQVGDIIQPFIIAPQGWYSDSSGGLNSNTFWDLSLYNVEIVYEYNGTIIGSIIDPYNGWTGSSSGSYIVNSSLIQDLNTIYNLPTLIFKEPSSNTISNVSYPFWTSIGSNYIESSGNLLNYDSLASINYFNTIFNNVSFLQTSPNRDQTGYDEITTKFTVEIGDQFRFGYDENNVYTVVSQSFTITGFFGTVSNRIFFDQNISTSGLTNYELNRFLIRRVIPDPALIIFEYTKPQGIGADGFIYPAAIGDALENNIDKIQEKLKRDNVI
jgi:hypothetical protein